MRCGAPAVGPCATCLAMICGDCAEITGGEVKKVAVCGRCHRQGKGEISRATWLEHARWPLALVGAIGALGVLLRLCSS